MIVMFLELLGGEILIGIFISKLLMKFHFNQNQFNPISQPIIGNLIKQV
jgi:uncharacterized protein YneF (UPF0154 family)